ncbi:carbon-nitrogen hydrolase family protein [Dyadobacter pollutisoli]|uniref:Carbon-nitrogen hydrolase family protein n=1 Tax=Dyadobacter pollutisoli TaxID=2910158 RepID=A0A9E8SJ44_9BACT|nr:carbon-nitrogen hydrolase family protein [Dyadobacter pollutisoli]WAC10503.1 carbon-nitrogen hydrolase family protein [Dyadobacter pollutisoli]
MSVTIASAQYPITEHADFGSWAKHIESWVADAAGKGADLLLFPEYGAMELVSIFSEAIRNDIRRQVKELNAIGSDFCQVFEKLARKYNVIIVAPSIPVIDSGKNLNRAYVFSPAGLAGYQDKFFMTRFENEQWGIESAPKTLTIFETTWGKFGIQICYDVEFAIGSQLLCAAGASLLLAPSCTETIRGATRVHVGARARALENQAYSVVSQTVGQALWSPAVDINYGYAAFYSTPDKDLPEQGIISSMTPQKEGWLIQQLDFSKINAVREDGAVFNFKDHERLHTTIKEENIGIVIKKLL